MPAMYLFNKKMLCKVKLFLCEKQKRLPLFSYQLSVFRKTR
jgi:hypothetical protein